MKADSPEPIHAELQALVDTEILVAGLSSPVDQQVLQSALETLPGVESLSFLGEKIAIRDDPEKVTNIRLCGLIDRSGFHISEVESAPIVPTVYSEEYHG